MADKKISALTAASTPLAGTEVLPIVQGGATVKVAVSNLTAGRSFDALGMTLTSTDAGAAAAPLLELYRDSATPAASDTLGEIEFNGEDSAGNKQAYALFHGSILSPTSGAEQGQLHFETATAGALTEKMIIGTTNLVINEIGAIFNVRIEGDTDANLFYTDATNSRVGVGTISPAHKLDVVGTVGISSTTTLSGLTASTALALNASKEIVSVTNTGTGNNVLATSPTITSSPGSDVLTLIRDNGGVTSGRCLILDSVNDAQLNYAGIKFNAGGVNKGAILQETTGNIYFDAGNDLLLRPVGNLVSDRVYNVTVGVTNRAVFVDSTGVIGYLASVRESKANIKSIDDVSWLLDLNPVTFNYREKNKDGSYTDNVTDVLEYGLIAEDTEQVNPELCFYDVVDGQMKLRGVSYSKLVTPMLKLMQDQQKIINELQNKIFALEQLAK